MKKPASSSTAIAGILWLWLSLGLMPQIVASGQTTGQSVPQPVSAPKPIIIATPVLEPVPPCVVDPVDWQPGKTYAQGTSVCFKGQEFTCIQPHTSQVGWEPPNAPALWVADSSSDDWQPQAFYPTGALITFQGTNFMALQPHTSQVGWEPPNVPALWLPVRRVFSPYIDVSDPNRNVIAAQAVQQGVKSVTLASITAQNGCSASWFGAAPIFTGDQFSSLINLVRAAKSDVILSFGGPSGTDLAIACPDAASLAAQYERVISTYQATMIDFDIEGPTLTNAEIDRLNAAVAVLKSANPRLIISYTLPILVTGLTEAGLEAGAAARSLHVPIINLVVRDASSASDVIQAVDTTLGDMGFNEPGPKSVVVGVTPVIGVNVSTGQAFTQQDAQTLLEAAQDSTLVGRLSMWSINRDQPCTLGSTSCIAAILANFQ